MAIIAPRTHVRPDYCAVFSAGNVYTEVNVINKQKFLAELGKLLTFMYEEDRQSALAMYSKMFDDTDSEEALIQFLGSPTRQAVVVARAYNARVRKLQVESQSREEDGGIPEAAPDFVLAIDKLYQQFIPEHSEQNRIMDDQFSLFEDMGHPADDGLDAVYPVLELSTAQEDGAEDVRAIESAPEAAPEEEAAADEVDSFLEGFRIPDDAMEDPADEEIEEVSVPVEVQSETFAYVDSEAARKPRVFLLILFVLLAVPVTLIGLVLLLIPTLLCLALAAAAIVAGAALAAAAFGGFKILADFLLLFGSAVILLALGLLFLWLFVWFIGGAIAGMIAGVIELGRQWCYKEVAA